MSKILNEKNSQRVLKDALISLSKISEHPIGINTLNTCTPNVIFNQSLNLILEKKSKKYLNVILKNIKDDDLQKNEKNKKEKMFYDFEKILKKHKNNNFEENSNSNSGENNSTAETEDNNNNSEENFFNISSGSNNTNNNKHNNNNIKISYNFFKQYTNYTQQPLQQYQQITNKNSINDFDMIKKTEENLNKYFNNSNNNKYNNDTYNNINNNNNINLFNNNINKNLINNNFQNNYCH